jgi:hypothetical protein
MNVEIIEATNNPCPTCGKGFDTEQGKKTHHAHQHGVSIAKEEKECEECGEVFESYSYRNRKFCSRKCLGKYTTGEGADNQNWKPDIVLSCEMCGEDFEVPPKRQEEARFCSYNCANEWKSKEYKGENHHRWKDSVDRLYYGRKWEDIRENVIERDNSKCQACGSGDDISIHHITPFRDFDDIEKANSMENLISLCRSCHTRVEFDKIECPEVNT